MRRFGVALLVTLVAMVCWVATAAARANTGDAAATHAYLEAKIALHRATANQEPAELKAIAALEAQVKAECPRVLAEAPPSDDAKANRSERAILDEVTAATVGAAEHVGHSAAARFARIVRRLRWSNPKLTKLLRSLAVEQSVQSAIPTPDLCADLKFWVASGYTAVSAGTKRYLHRLSAVASITTIEAEPHEPALDILDLNALVAYRLRPYEDRADRLLARKALRTEAKGAATELKLLLEAIDRLDVALGRSPDAAE